MEGKTARSGSRSSTVVRTVLVVIGCGLLVMGCSGGPSRTDPEDLKSDIAAGAENCYSGDLAACDSLAVSTSPDSPLNGFARLCGGRVEVAGEACLERFGQVTPLPATAPPEPVLDLAGRAEACEGGDLAACDALGESAPAGSEIAQYGLTCGGRIDSASGRCMPTLSSRLPAPLPLLIPAGGTQWETTASQCSGGLLAACDELRRATDPVLATFAGRCGGRSETVASCVDHFADRTQPTGLPLEISAAGYEGSVDACYGGDLAACDRLADAAPSPLADWAKTCGGRSDPSGRCTSEFRSEIGFADDLEDLVEDVAAELAPLAFRCQGSDLAACDALSEGARREAIGSLGAYGASCGNRNPTTARCVDDAFLASVPPALDWRQFPDDSETQMVALAKSCSDNDWNACVVLAERARAARPAYDEYLDFANSCGGFESAEDEPAACRDAFATASPVVATSRPSSTTTSSTSLPPTSDTTVSPPTTVPNEQSGTDLTEASREELLELVKEAVEGLTLDDLVVTGGDDLQVGSRRRLTVEVANDVPLDGLGEFLQSRKVRVEVQLRLGGPGTFDVEDSSPSRYVSVRFDASGARLEADELGDLAVTPQTSGSHKPEFRLDLLDDGATLETATFEGPEVVVAKAPGSEWWTIGWERLVAFTLVLAGVAGVIKNFETIANFVRRGPGRGGSTG